MKLKQIIDESFGDYKECSMLLVTPSCSWKCKDCHNKHLSYLPTQNFPNEEILKRFANNPLTSAIVIGGLEPLDDMHDVRSFIFALRQSSLRPTVVIYTGYELHEIEDELYWSGLEPEMLEYGNCILKYGRFQPIYNIQQDRTIKRLDTWNEDLGVALSSPNQKTINYNNKTR